MTLPTRAFEAGPDRESAVFALALEQPASGRAAWLRSACRDDPLLHDRLLALLEAHERPAVLNGLEEEPEAGADDETTRSDGPLGAADEAVGQCLGPYRLLEQLGEGGCGRVYVAEQTEPVRRRVAVKVIKLGMDTRQVVARFEAERQALALMDHPNIARVLDAGTTAAGRPFFVMELVRGLPITDYCDQAGLDTRARLDLVIKVCQAIQHAHQKGIIHRDIKPSNVLVTLHDGVPVPKVIDFGIAKATEGRLADATIYTQLHQVIGTPAYMSPEQAEMSGLDIDTRSDIYSLGVLLYQILTGRTPFDARELVAAGIDGMRRTIREREPVRPSTRLAALPIDELTTTARRRSADTTRLLRQLRGDLDWIVMKCLEKDRARRYETANGLAADLRRYLDNEPIVARPPSPTYRLRKAIRRNRVVCASGVLVFLALASGVSLSSWQALRATRANRAETAQRIAAQAAQARAETERAEAEQSRQLARLNLYAADVNGARHLITEGSLGAARSLLAGLIPAPGQEELRGWEWRHAWKRAQGDQLHRFEGHRYFVGKVEFSPDGLHLYSLGKAGAFRPSGELIAWDWAARRHLRTLNHSADIADFSVSPDGSRVALLTAGGELGLWDAGLVAARESCPVAKVRTFRFSALDSAIYLQDDRRRVVRWDPAGAGEPRIIDAGPAYLRDLSPDGSRLLLLAGDRALVRRLPEGTVEAVAGPLALGRWTHGLRFLPESTRVISPFAYEGPVVTDLRLGTWSRPFAGFDSEMQWDSQVAFAARKGLMATATFNHALLLWDLGTFALRARLLGHGEEVWCAAFSPDGRFLASGGQDRSVLLWTTNPSEEIRETAGTFDATGPVFSPDGRHAALARTNGRVAIVDLESGAEAVSIPGDLTPLRFTAGGSGLLLMGPAGIVEWDTAARTRRGVRPLDFVPLQAPPNAELHHLCRTSTPEWVTERDLEGHLRVVDLATGTTRIRLPTAATVAALSAEASLLATAVGENDGPAGIQVWDLRNPTEPRLFVGHDRSVRDLKFSADGRRLASGSLDSTIRLWDVATGRTLHVLRGHKRGTFGVAFSADDRTLASVNHDRTVRLWNLPTGREIGRFELPLAALRVGFSPDGRFLVAVIPDGSGSRIWEAPPLEALAGIGPTSGTVDATPKSNDLDPGRPSPGADRPAFGRPQGPPEFPVIASVRCCGSG